MFPKFSGEEFENFMALADKLRSDYDFGHTLDAKLIPRGESVSKPTLRLLKPFDELFVDSEVFLDHASSLFLPIYHFQLFSLMKMHLYIAAILGLQCRCIGKIY